MKLNIIYIRDLSYEEFLLMKLKGYDKHKLLTRFILDEQIINESFYELNGIELFENQTLSQELIIKYFNDINPYYLFEFQHVEFNTIKKLSKIIPKETWKIMFEFCDLILLKPYFIYKHITYKKE